MAARANTEKSKPIAVIDIGSNSVRLAIYRLKKKKKRGCKNPFEMVYQSRATCCLGRKLLHDKPQLDRKGMAKTLKALKKFRKAIQKRKLRRVMAIGTAAMRAVIHTQEGRAFHRRAQRALGHEIEIISGRKEARLTAYGVMSALPKVAGICGDLGGGSLELASISHGRVIHTTTMPLGSLTLINESGKDMWKAGVIMHEHLQHVPWLGRASGRTFYPIGGSWRAVARVMMRKMGRPIGRAHGFTISGNYARELATGIARQKPGAFKKMHKKVRQRADTIPVAAAILAELIDRMRPRKIVFSAHGVREGMLKDRVRA